MIDCVVSGLCQGTVVVLGRCEPSSVWGDALPDSVASPSGPNSCCKQGEWAHSHAYAPWALGSRFFSVKWSWGADIWTRVSVEFVERSGPGEDPYNERRAAECERIPEEGGRQDDHQLCGKSGAPAKQPPCCKSAELVELSSVALRLGQEIELCGCLGCVRQVVCGGPGRRWRGWEQHLRCPLSQAGLRPSLGLSPVPIPGSKSPSSIHPLCKLVSFFPCFPLILLPTVWLGISLSLGSGGIAHG